MALREEFKKQGDFLFRNRSYLPLLFLAVGLLVFITTKDFSKEDLKACVFEPYKFLCLGVCLFGLTIRVTTVGHTPGSTSGRNTTEGQIADELNTTGIYSLVRHPLYLGNFFMWLGVAMLTENFWFIIAFIFFYYVYYERIMFAEENFLRNEFGERYLQWASKVPAFIPKFRKYTKAKYGFCLKKVLKQEKNGLAAVFLLFWLFSVISDIKVSKHFIITYDFWFYAAIISSVIYLILKILKKKRLLEQKGR